MSIVDQTVKQLVRSRVHELCDRVMDMNIKQGRQVVLMLDQAGVTVVDSTPGQTPGRFSSVLPPNRTPTDALEGLEEMLSSVRAHQSQGAKR